MEAASAREVMLRVLGGVKVSVYIDGWKVVLDLGLVLNVPTMKGKESGMARVALAVDGRGESMPFSIDLSTFPRCEFPGPLQSRSSQT